MTKEIWEFLRLFTMQALDSELAKYLRSLNGRHCKSLGSNSHAQEDAGILRFRMLGSCRVAQHITVEAFEHCSENCAS